MRSFKASLNINPCLKTEGLQGKTQLWPSGVVSTQQRVYHPCPRPPTRSFNVPRETKTAPHTDLIDLSIGAISNHFHQLKNPSRILEKRGGVRI